MARRGKQGPARGQDTRNEKTRANRRTPTKGTEKGTGASYAAPTMQYANFGAGSAAYLDPSDPGYAPTPADTTVRLRKGGYTKVDGKLYKGTYAGVNNAPYVGANGQVPNPTPWTGMGGKGKTVLFTGPGGAASPYSDPKLFKQYIKQAEAAGYGSGNYSKGGLGRGEGTKGRGGRKGHNRALKDGAGLGGPGAAGAATTADALGFGGPGPDAFVPYAEADTATTNYTRAQGKAYGRGTGSSVMGGTSTPPDQTAAEEESSVASSPGRNRRKAKRLTHKAKAKSSPGGRKVTTKERARIRKAKGK